MGVILIFIIVSIILEVTSSSCLHKFIHFTHFINLSFFSSSVFLLLFFITVFILMDVVLMFIIVSIILEVTSSSCLHTFIHFTHFINLSFFSSSVFILLFFITVFILMDVVLMFFINLLSFTHFINFSFFSSSVFLLLFFITVFILMDVVLIFLIVSIILEISSCSCLHQFLQFTHIHKFLLCLFFCLPSPLLHHCLHTHGCCPNIHHRFYCTRSQPFLLSSLISSFYSY